MVNFLFNFLTPAVFYLSFKLLGAKPAIAFAVSVSVFQFLFYRIMQIKISPFFIIAAGFTVLFGSIDLMIHTPRFFKLEPFAQNFIMGILFLISTLTKKPVIYYFAHSLPELLKSEMKSILNDLGYLKKITWVWSIYFFIKAFLFLFLAFQVDLGKLIVLRTLIGGPTLLLMVGGEIVIRKIRQKKA